MTSSMETTVKKLERMVHAHGAAQVSVWLGYRDTRAVWQWIQREEIPKARVDLVKTMIKKNGG